MPIIWYGLHGIQQLYGIIEAGRKPCRIVGGGYELGANKNKFNI